MVSHENDFHVLNGKKKRRVTINQLIERCQAKDPKAQRTLYEKYKDVLFPIARRYVKDWQDAEDVFAKAMFKNPDKGW